MENEEALQPWLEGFSFGATRVGVRHPTLSADAKTREWVWHPAPGTLAFLLSQVSKTSVQFHDILYTLFREMLYTSARALASAEV